MRQPNVTKHISGAMVVALLGVAAPLTAQTGLTLQHAVDLAQQSDPWLEGSHYREEAVLAKSVAAGSLPDPKVSLGLANLPVDSFDFNQEAMTQFQVSVSQMFPRGETRKLQRRQLREQGGQFPHLRVDRRAKITASVTQLWLESYRHQKALKLINQDRALFEHLVDVAESSYTSALGKTRQQDLVRAQLELTRLEDRLAVLEQQRETSQASLEKWLPSGVLMDAGLSSEMPELALAIPDALHPGSAATEQITNLLLAHPVIKNLDQKIIATRTGVELAKQKYKPQWGISASYGYRDDDPMGIDRSDFFSVGVNFEIPLFTANRQDREVQAAQATEAAIKTEKALALRDIRGSFETARARLKRLNQRKALYEERLLEEVHDQAVASLTAYTNDAGDFAEVVRARIAELNTNIDFLNIKVDRLQAIAELNYFLTPSVAGLAGEVSP